MFGSLGFTEIAFVLILALLLFGPKRLPEIGKTIGKGLAEFRRASNDLKRTLEREVAFDEVEQRAAGARAAATGATLTPLQPPTLLDPNASGREAAKVAAGATGDAAPEPAAQPPAADPQPPAAEPPPAEPAPATVTGERPD